MPLGATKLYLFGISVDQQFHSNLTRLTDTALRDMTTMDCHVLPTGLVLDARRR